MHYCCSQAHFTRMYSCSRLHEWNWEKKTVTSEFSEIPQSCNMEFGDLATLNWPVCVCECALWWATSCLWRFPACHPVPLGRGPQALSEPAWDEQNGGQGGGRTCWHDDGTFSPMSIVILHVCVPNTQCCMKAWLWLNWILIDRLILSFSEVNVTGSTQFANGLLRLRKTLKQNVHSQMTFY